MCISWLHGRKGILEMSGVQNRCGFEMGLTHSVLYRSVFSTHRKMKLIKDAVKPVANVILVRPHMANSETDVEHVWPGHSQDASIFIILKYVVKASWTPEDPCNEHVQVAQPTFVTEWQNPSLSKPGGWVRSESFNGSTMGSLRNMNTRTDTRNPVQPTTANGLRQPLGPRTVA